MRDELDDMDRLRHIRAACEKIMAHDDGSDFEAFAADDFRVDGFVRNLMIIGEAATQLTPVTRAAVPGVPWDQVRKMRNLLVHGYFVTNTRIVFATVRNDVPDLLDAVTLALRALEAD